MEKKVAKLVSINFDNTYKNTLYFDSRQQQTNFFNNLNGIYYNDFLMLYKSKNTTRINLNSEEVRKYNYLFVTNLDGTYTYYFITNFNGYNEEVTELELEIDVWNTYYFDRQIMSCLVDREHSASDEIGENINAEPVPIGDYKYSSPKQIKVFSPFDGEKIKPNFYTKTDLFNEPCVIVGVSEIWNDGAFESVQGQMLNGTYSAIKFFRFNPFIRIDGSKDFFINDEELEKLDNFLKKYNSEGKRESVHCVFMFASDLIGELSLFGNGQNVATSDGFRVDLETNEDKNFYYTPKNKKLLTAPYKQLLVTNGQGTAITLERQKTLLNEGKYSFGIYTTMQPNASYTLVAKGYNGKLVDLETSITIEGMPICNWINDNLANWYAKNKTDLLVSGATAIGTTALGVVTGSPVAIAGGIGFAVNTLKSAVIESKKPDTVQGNKFDGNSLITSDLLDFYFYEVGLTEENAKLIDDFFTMYGYKTAAIKIPNIAVRPHYTYTKTVNCLINGRIPIEHKKQIEKIFDDGVTIWRNENNIGNYTLENGVN